MISRKLNKSPKEVKVVNQANRKNISPIRWHLTTIQNISANATYASMFLITFAEMVIFSMESTHPLQMIAIGAALLLVAAVLFYGFLQVIRVEDNLRNEDSL